MTTALREHLSHLQRSRSLTGRPGRAAAENLSDLAAPPRQRQQARGGRDREVYRRDLVRRLCRDLGARLHAGEQGEVLVWEKCLSQVWSEGARVARQVWAALDGGGAGVGQRGELEPLARSDPSRVGWLDIETAGFIGRPIFLVGLLRPVGGELVITQLLARDYAQERAMLTRCLQEVSGLEVLVTFNGRCFDLPFLRDRMAYHRLSGWRRGFETCAAVDLLWAARRCWRGRVPDCRLQTLERHFCRRMRAGDVPGALIPQRYHDFVRTGEPSLIAPVMRHNRLDLVTMAELSSVLLGEP